MNKNKEYYKEYYYRTIVDLLGGVKEGLIQGVAFDMRWPVLNNKLTPSIKIVYSIPLVYDTNREARYGSLYLNPKLDIMPFETFNIIIGSELFFASCQKKFSEFCGRSYN